MASILLFPFQVAAALVFLVYYLFVSLFHFFFPKQKSLEGEVVLITGAGSGIGRLMALRFAANKSVLVLWDLNAAGNEETAAMCRKTGATVFAYTVDVSKREVINAAADRVKSEVGTVTILVNNAGIVSGKPFLECTDAQVERTMAVNIHAHFWTCKAFIPAMIENNHGHLVTIASSAGMVGVAGLADYCASKFAAFGFDESLRQEFQKLGKTGVKTTCVCPYFIDTGMFEGVKTKFPFLMPILQPDYVADKILNAIRTDAAILVMPRFGYIAPSLRLFPVVVMDEAAKWLGISDSMDSFKGRAAPAGKKSK